MSLRAKMRVFAALEPEQIQEVDRLCTESGQPRSAWVRSCVIRMIDRSPIFPDEGVLALVQVRQELRRISVAARMLAARAEAGGTTERIIDDAWKLHAEIRRQLEGVRAAVAGNLAYWDGADE